MWEAYVSAFSWLLFAAGMFTIGCVIAAAADHIQQELGGFSNEEESHIHD
jgi:hypothetical protein